MAEESQRFESMVWFECPSCRENASTAVEVPEPDWSDIEKTSDMEGWGYYEVSCPECNAAFTASVTNYGGQVEVKLTDHPETVVSADMPHFSEEPVYDEDPPANPDLIFFDAFAQISLVLNEYGDDENGYDLINRMCFVQYISAFEAYLAEKLVTRVDSDGGALARLLTSDKILREMKLSLADILKDPEIVRMKVRSYLRSIVYHRMRQVNALYDSALGIKIINSNRAGDVLTKMMDARHDCVHRNGFTIDGEKNLTFLRYFVRSSAKTLKALVERIERELDLGLASDETLF